MNLDAAELRRRAQEYRARAATASFLLRDEYLPMANTFDDVAEELERWEARYGKASGRGHRLRFAGTDPGKHLALEFRLGACRPEQP